MSERFGAIQRDIIAYLLRCGPSGGPIGSTTKADEFRGLDLAQVERSIACLMGRGIIKKEGIRYLLVYPQHHINLK